MYMVVFRMINVSQKRNHTITQLTETALTTTAMCCYLQNLLAYIIMTVVSFLVGSVDVGVVTVIADVDCD